MSDAILISSDDEEEDDVVNLESANNDSVLLHSKNPDDDFLLQSPGLMKKVANAQASSSVQSSSSLPSAPAASSSSSRTRTTSTKTSSKNKKRTTTVEQALAEMIVCSSADLRSTPFQMELSAALQDVGCTMVTASETAVARSVLWKRRQQEATISLCPVMVVVVPGQQFAQWARSDQLLVELARHQSVIGSSGRVLWLVEAMRSYLLSEQHTLNQNVRQAVRMGIADSHVRGSAAAAPRPSPSMPAPIDYQFECVQLQFHGCQVLDVASGKDGARVVAELTRALAQQPYRSQVQFASFCAESVRQPAARGLSAWGKQLMLVRGVSRDVAEAVVAQFPSLQALAAAFDQAAAAGHDPALLLNRRVTVHRPASGTSAPINEPISRAIHFLFTETDGSSLVPWASKGNAKKKKK